MIAYSFKESDIFVKKTADMKKKYTYIDIFAGCGGLSEGE